MKTAAPCTYKAGRKQTAHNEKKRHYERKHRHGEGLCRSFDSNNKTHINMATLATLLALAIYAAGVYVGVHIKDFTNE